ncbi:MAG TPA: DUF2520 domain-containing protein [Syntrophales bacterium]|nr:DUF2520 domain-containing protein [Syntrophales bacterium]HOL59735.1 DUF2520 domain-containing protein [Syntrophales bacterium]HPO35881.1 DUF2520 domain-containing protein [Syntrophales bacterium]
MESINRETFAIIGLGKVGTAIGFLMRKAGFEITAVADISEEALKKGHPYTGGHATRNIDEAARRAENVIITTLDDEIAPTCEAIASAGAVRPKQKFIHMSGAGSLDLLQSVRRQGAETACIHPLQSFASVSGAIENIPGSVFGITAQSPEVELWAQDFVHRLGGIPFFIKDGDEKTLYHVAACLASNYLTTLMHFVKLIYQKLGMEEEMAIKSVLPLVRGTIKNIEERGTVSALTGPIARGDAGTIGRHLSALSRAMPEMLPYYRLLGLATVELAQEKGAAKAENLKTIEALLKGEEI